MKGKNKRDGSLYGRKHDVHRRCLSRRIAKLRSLSSRLRSNDAKVSRGRNCGGNFTPTLIYRSVSRCRAVLTCQKIHHTRNEHRRDLVPAQPEEAHQHRAPEDYQANQRARDTQILHT